jgi:hypothetical protein
MDLFTAIGILFAALGLAQIALRDLEHKPNRTQHPPAPLSELSTGV